MGTRAKRPYIAWPPALSFLLGLLIVFVGHGRAFAGDRPDIMSYSPAARALLYTEMSNYISQTVILEHLLPTSTLPNKHMSDRFLVWHRNYLKGMEDYLVSQNLPQFVPLPKWDPTTSSFPPEFAGVDIADCLAAATAAGALGDTAHCLALNNSTNPWINILPVPASLSNNLCSQSVFSYASSGFTFDLEVNLHNTGHIALGGVMWYYESPSAPIFWLWHAYIDDIWFDWQCGCGRLEGATEGAAFSAFTPSERITNLWAGVADAWMRDSASDIGSEPNNETGAAGEVLYLSPDIWVRNTRATAVTDFNTMRFTNEHQHQNPEYSANPANTPWIYVKVRNRGCVTVTGEVHVYWANASTGLTWQSPDFHEVTPAVPLTITAGREADAEFHWTTIPDPNLGNGDHFCLAARFVANPTSSDPINGEQTNVDISGNVYHSNQIAWKNLTIVDNVANKTVFVRNISQNGNFVRLAFNVPVTQRENSIFQHGAVSIDLGPELFTRWIQNGARGNGIEVDPRGIVRVLGPDATIDGLPIAFREQFLVAMQFGPGPDPCEDDTTVFDLYLNAYEGQTFMGGNAYEIHPQRILSSPEIVIESLDPPINCANGSVRLHVTTMLPAGTALQWLRDGAAVPGATGFQFAATQSGHYSVHAAYPNSCDRDSPEFPVYIGTPPVNDSPCGATLVAMGQPVGFDIRCATSDPGEVTPGPGSDPQGGCYSNDGWCLSDTAVQNSVWYRFIAPVTGPVSIHAGHLDHNSSHAGLATTQLAVWIAGACSSFNTYQLIAANDNSGDHGTWGGDPALHNLAVVAGTEYYIQIDGFQGDRGTGMLSIEPGVVPCACDWNHDSILNSQDFFDFVNDLFNGSADFNGDGVTNSQDFFDFLNCLFGGCP